MNDVEVEPTVWVTPPRITEYPVIGDPPSLAGAVHETLIPSAPAATAVTPVGAPGAVAGTGTTTELELAPAEDPTALFALTSAE